MNAHRSCFATDGITLVRGGRDRGVGWQHRRAVDPLEAGVPSFRRLRPDIEIAWEARPLAGFEFQPVEESAEAIVCAGSAQIRWVQVPLALG